MTDRIDMPHLAKRTWREVEASFRSDAIVLIPTGAVEAHGPHLPLDTDVIIATATAERVAALLINRGDIAVIAPPLIFGVSYVGACFPGTIPQPASLIVDLIVNLVGGIAKWGPRRFAVVNAHLEPAHIAALHSAIAECQTRHRVQMAFADQRQAHLSARLSEEFQQGARHAGSYETSIVLAAAPESVRRDVLPTLSPVWIDLPAKLRAGATTFLEAGGIEGYFGDPTLASAEEGSALLDQLAVMVVEAIDALEPESADNAGAT